MREHTRQSLHFGANFVFAPLPAIDAERQVLFMQELARSGLEFGEIKRDANSITLGRQETPFEVRILQNGPVGQLLMLAPRPARMIADFIDEAQAVCAAFRQVWPAPLQIVRRDCSIRHLYVSEGDHAFQYLWERRLKQPGEQLALFGRPVLGGGLRFVMPPAGDGTGANPTQVEVKIESYLEDSKKIYVDVAFVWPQPLGAGAQLDPAEILGATDDFATTQVVHFIRGENA